MSFHIAASPSRRVLYVLNWLMKHIISAELFGVVDRLRLDSLKSSQSLGRHTFPLSKPYCCPVLKDRILQGWFMEVAL